MTDVPGPPGTSRISAPPAPRASPLDPMRVLPYSHPELVAGWRLAVLGAPVQIALG